MNRVTDLKKKKMLKAERVKESANRRDPRGKAGLRARGRGAEQLPFISIRPGKQAQTPLYNRQIKKITLKCQKKKNNKVNS